MLASNKELLTLREANALAAVSVRVQDLYEVFNAAEALQLGASLRRFRNLLLLLRQPRAAKQSSRRLKCERKLNRR